MHRFYTRSNHPSGRARPCSHPVRKVLGALCHRRVYQSAMDRHGAVHMWCMKNDRPSGMLSITVDSLVYARLESHWRSNLLIFRLNKLLIVAMLNFIERLSSRSNISIIFLRLLLFCILLGKKRNETNVRLKAEELVLLDRVIRWITKICRVQQ